MKPFVIVMVGVLGSLALLAGLHHVVVASAPDTAFAQAFSGTCASCHGAAEAPSAAAADQAGTGAGGRGGVSAAAKQTPNRGDQGRSGG